MTKLSIGWRLTLWYGGLLALALAGFACAVYFVFSRTLLVEVDRAVAEELAEIDKAVRESPDRESLERRLYDEFGRHPLYVIQLQAAAGEVFFENDLARLNRPESPSDLSGSFESLRLQNGREFRGGTLAASGPAGEFRIFAADSLDLWRESVNHLLLVMLGAAPVVLAGAMGGGWLLSRRALSPIDSMINTVVTITGDQLDRRVFVANPADELGRLALTFNAMIARLERTFGEMRRFTADAAHELRTPLSVLRSEAEVALRADRAPEQYRRVLRNQIEEIDRLSRLADQLLFLCREDSRRQEQPLVPVRVDRLLVDLADDLQPVVEDQSLSFVIDSLPACRIQGDPDRLRRLCYNLIDNAMKYTPSGGTIRVSAALRGSQCCIAVSDTGIGIAPEHVAHLFDRFYRVESSRTTPGFGLGLAICRSIAESHGGSMTVTSAPGRGTTVEFQLPAWPVEAEFDLRPKIDSPWNSAEALRV